METTPTNITLRSLDFLHLLIQVLQRLSTCVASGLIQQKLTEILSQHGKFVGTLSCLLFSGDNQMILQFLQSEDIHKLKSVLALALSLSEEEFNKSVLVILEKLLILLNHISTSPAVWILYEPKFNFQEELNKYETPHHMTQSRTKELRQMFGDDALEVVEITGGSRSTKFTALPVAVLSANLRGFDYQISFVKFLKQLNMNTQALTATEQDTKNQNPEMDKQKQLVKTMLKAADIQATDNEAAKEIILTLNHSQLYDAFRKLAINMGSNTQNIDGHTLIMLVGIEEVAWFSIPSKTKVGLLKQVVQTVPFYLPSQIGTTVQFSASTKWTAVDWSEELESEVMMDDKPIASYRHFKFGATVFVHLEG
mmetsp:Transcript_1478/g.1957  ORF Transcript_1478/g.1957 Transcript_1478/m.1957 type:complete len:367 (+) Transcript_1478:2-1102(+)